MNVNRLFVRAFNQRRLPVRSIASFYLQIPRFSSQICRLLSSSQVQRNVDCDTKTCSASGCRTVFHGTNVEKMFTAQTAVLPELAAGEILVKVMAIDYGEKIFVFVE